jgi:hypothetical protein
MAPVTEMKIKEIRAAVLRRWFSLPSAERATEQQAVSFANEAIQLYDASTGKDVHAMIKKLLAPYTGLTPLH